MSWSIKLARAHVHEREIKNNLYRAPGARLIHLLNDAMIAVILSYVPVAKPSTPISTIITSFAIVKKPRLVLCQQTIISMIGGNTRARAVLLTAPTRDMKRPNFGIASARITEEKIIMYINNLQAIYFSLKIKYR